MQSSLPHIRQYANKASASLAVSQDMASTIAEAIKERGKAHVLLSGGSTPKDAYRLLFEHDLPWEKVVFIPVDDRWVYATDAGSNYGMIKTLLANSPHNNAQLERLVPETNFDPKLTSGMSDAFAKLAPDFCLMGMGIDGHTASWFPNSTGLHTALDSDTDCNVTAIDASGCPGAGAYPYRVTFTRPAILKARSIILFITGYKKADVLKSAVSKTVNDAPVKALFDAGSRLTVIWAP